MAVSTRLPKNFQCKPTTLSASTTTGTQKLSYFEKLKIESKFKMNLPYAMNIATTLLLASLLQGCQNDIYSDGLSSLSVEAQQENARSNLICQSVTPSEVSKVIGIQLAHTAALSPRANWCRFILNDNSWFDVSAIRIGRVGEITADCYDDQNSERHTRIYHPFCFAVTNGWQLKVESDKRPSITKPKMLRLLELSFNQLYPKLQLPPDSLFGGKG